MPYRGGRERKARKTPKVAAVSEMVRQFSDPYAFLRELIQNGVDAGATSLEVHVHHGADGVATTTVTDDGSGMTREIIEGPLLTLFSSSKEGDGSKIGKYGVGFMSVFAIEPTVVTVTTWRRDGAWLVRLSPDHSYELEQADPRPGSGSAVTLFQQLDRDGFADHVARVRSALRQWCRHVAVPTRILVGDATGSDRSEERIDAPMDVRSVAWVEVAEGRDRFVVGVGATPAAFGGDRRAEDSNAYAGFFNRGLLLYETTNVLLDDQALSGLDGIRYKIDSPSLAHTLSRDNVRRDDAFRRLVSKIRRIVRRELRDAARRRIAELADAAPTDEAARDHVELVVHARRAPLALRDRDVVLPVASPFDGRRSLAITEIESATPIWQRPLRALEEDDLTRALAEHGRPVVRMSPEALSRLDVLVWPADRVFSLVVPVEGDRELWDAVAGALAAAGRPAASVQGARILGWFPKSAAVALAAEGAGARLERGDRLSSKWRSGHDLFVLLDAPIVSSALDRSRAGQLAFAAALLSRALLVQGRGPLGETAADCLIEANLEAIAP